jgi:hypothetical protein
VRAGARSLRATPLQPAAALLLALGAIALVVWRAQLFTVARPGERPQPLAARPAGERVPARLDVVLPAVPVGMRRLHEGGGVLLIHYWAPWERHALDQARGLDSLRREPDLERLQAAIVCFDPFPSVSRYVARQRLRLAVLLDGPGELRRTLPCPSIPYTYVIDAAGRVAVAQAGEVDWRAPETREALARLLAEPGPPSAPDPPASHL